MKRDWGGEDWKFINSNRCILIETRTEKLQNRAGKANKDIKSIFVTTRRRNLSLRIDRMLANLNPITFSLLGYFS